MPHVKYNQLPEEIRGQLLARQTEENGIFIETTNNTFRWVLLLVSVASPFLLLFLVRDNSWSTIKIIVLSALTLAAVYSVLRNSFFLLLRFVFGLRQGVLITSCNIIDFQFNDLWFWNLDQLLSVHSSRGGKRGMGHRSQIVFVFEDCSRCVKVANPEIAETIVDKATDLRKLFVEAVTRKDTTYLESNIDLAELTTPRVDDRPFAVNMKRTVFAILIAAVITAIVIFYSLAANRYYDDKLSWDSAQANDRPSGYRNYLQMHPQGRWNREANSRLQNLYDVAEEHYRASLNKGYDPKAAAAVSSILRYAKSSQNYRVKVTFDRHNLIPDNVLDKLKTDYKIKNLLPMDDNFADAKMQRRENEVSAVIATAFGKVIPNDVLQVSGECNDECIEFHVKYDIDVDGTYYDTRQEDLPDSERIYYPGIVTEWDFGIHIPNSSDEYNFQLTSVPDETFDYNYKGNDIAGNGKDFKDVLARDLGNIYDGMASSCFEDFERKLIFRMGIGELPVDRDTKRGEFVKVR